MDAHACLCSIEDTASDEQAAECSKPLRNVTSHVWRRLLSEETEHLPSLHLMILFAKGLEELYCQKTCTVTL